MKFMGFDALKQKPTDVSTSEKTLGDYLEVAYAEICSRLREVREAVTIGVLPNPVITASRRLHVNHKI